MLNHWMRLILLLMLSIGLVACSDDSTKPNGGNDPGNNDDPKPNKEFSYLLLPSMATDIELNPNGSLSLKVLLVSVSGKDSGIGVANEPIQWSVEQGDKHVTLRAAATDTDDGGYSSVLVMGTEEAGEAKIVAYHPKARLPVSFKILVHALPTGSLLVRANYAGLAPVRHYSIRLHDLGDVSCEQFDPAYPPNKEPLAKIDAQTAEFKDLSLEQRYSLVAYGYSDKGAMVAAGCLDKGIIILADQRTELLVNLQTIELDMSSAYHVRSYFDFGDIAYAMGEVGKMIRYISDFVDNPGRNIYEILYDKVIAVALGSVLPAWVPGGLDWVLKITGLKAKLEDYLNELVKQNKTACQVGLFGCQLRSMVRTMELLGELHVQRLGALQLTGKSSYNGLALYWRIGCDGTDPNCGRLPISVEQLNLNQSLSLLEGDWSGSISNGYDRLSIESHELKMHYGKILVFVIEKVLLPKVANGATNFPDAVAHWINCHAVAQWLHNTLKVTVPVVNKTWQIELETARNWCRSTSNFLAQALNLTSMLAAAQQVSSNVTISGTAFVHDSSGDNGVDHIDNGTWNGNLILTQGGSSTSTAVLGVWSAYNRKNKSKDYCSFPKTASDSADQNCAYPAINLNALSTNNMCAQYAACAK